VAVLCASLVVAVAVTTVSAGLLESIDEEVCALYEKSKDSVVKVHAQRLLPFGAGRSIPAQRVGTGFFIDTEGRLMTAATVVEGANQCWIDWKGERVPARILGRDPETNVALLKVDLDTTALPQANSDELRIGAMVVAVGFPAQYSSAPSVGSVSGFDIRARSHVFVTSHIRADCKLRRGYGGGPLLNARGEVVGMAVAADADDQCYALPINAAKKVCADFLQYGQPQHTWVGLGITERPINPDCKPGHPTQVVVQQVYSNTPAARAGFRDQDVIVRIVTNEVHQTADVLDRMFHHRAGERVTFTVLRDGQEHQLSLVVGMRPFTAIDVAESTPHSPSSPAHGPALRVVPATEER
jgi:serine protease Do